MSSKETLYPKDTATAEQILNLAAAYRKSAEALLPLIERRKAYSWEPYRLLVIHAIELYLNAQLLSKGCSPSEIRGMQHNLAKRAEDAAVGGLTLRKNTTTHLTDLYNQREYVAARYDTDNGKKSQINRLDATLADVAKKVTANVAATKTIVGTSPAQRLRA